MSCSILPAGERELVCLADRGGRELPFAPDYVGVTLELEPKQELVLIKDDDKLRLQVQARK